MKKRVIMMASVLLLILLSVSLIWFGIKSNINSKPKVIYSKVIDKLSDEIIGKVKNDRYNIGDNFSIVGNIDIELSSEYYSKESQTKKEYVSKNNILKNISKMDINYKIKQDEKQEKMYLELEERIGEESILSSKYMIDNFTKYYFVNGIVKNYVNNGSSNYFETLTEENTTIDNIDYLYNFIKESLKNNIKDNYYSTYQTDEDIEDEKKNVYSITLTLNNDRIKKILSGILSDLKKDEKTYNILNSFTDDFKKTKLDDSKVYLNKDEKIIINIYVDKLLYKPLKYKIIDEKKNDKYIFTIEDNHFVYIEDNMIKYNGTITIEPNKVKINVRDRKNNDVGSIKYETDDFNTTLSMSLSLEENKYNLEYSSKIKEAEKGKSYNCEKALKFKKMEGLINKIVCSAKVTFNVSNKVEISEDLSDSLLSSTLREEEKNKIKNLKNDIKLRLEK